METIDRRANLSYEEFINEYQKPGIPVVLVNATNVWKSNLMFTPEYFKKNFGDRITYHSNTKYTMSEILDIAANSTKTNPAPYPIKFDLLTQLPEVLTEMDPINLNLAKPNWLLNKVFPEKKMDHRIDLFIGGPGNHYTIHKDVYNVHAWLIQLYGEKEVILFPRDQEDLMYAGKLGVQRCVSPIDISNPDFEKYPKFKDASPIKTTLKAGEVIYIPSGIWHTTMANVHNISIIVDQLNSTNYKGWKKEVYYYKAHYNKSKAIFDYCAATVIGKVCLIGEFFGINL
ncbi:MAG: cupin-like domain-containing protein [Candidatus Pedobacter colombiensis]|uniref:Cupin-like domain-containing protein n=1 Tax=Candidatus Pedobacter colombiensis TaxID=3121371 RepID=A0AAJ5WCV8_9SPHI|nr:cupin-like domain-containing protein [Pedobacter sp.]WEK21134.1 MAG: cupin-like domain-containing protein [Pedobacter sp.]